ncbi:DUF2934 domain-containing protein [Archangium violaceum]|uniref:DUF2934 domain-containing protein n=1 Tax=Archangium violaceum TaxID=83451 RepID=UPI00193C5B8E|nr:DUF2934 domain-containing protein [Archangium violaceum]QRK08392.1 DUF2934 domain-containing protein [Archangium violaceum]
MARAQAKATQTQNTSPQKQVTETPRGAANTNTSRPGPTQEQIARRAYELYLARGGSHGRHEDDWLQAERELRLGR